MRCVVITGSREWTDRDAIALALTNAEVLLVGDCPTGADAIALEYAQAWDIIPVVLVADWKKLGNRAGPIRNQAIVDRALKERDDSFDVVCHAFPMPGSRGTHDCISRLKAASFAVVVHAG